MNVRTKWPVKSAILCLLGVIFLAGPAAFAWWAKGHENVAHVAVIVLPADMPEFFRNGPAAIMSSSTDPDWWSDRATPELRTAQARDHFIDLELLKGRQMPSTRGEFFALCKELHVEPSMVGFVPYAAHEWYERLVLALAEYRKHPDDRNVQAKVLYIAGVMSHFTADMTQPLHTTVDYDGRANPDGSSPRTGIHAKVDALLDRRPPLDMKLNIEAEKDIFAVFVRAIMESHGKVEKVYALEKRLPTPGVEGDVKPDAEVQALAGERFLAAVKLTATAWYSAWIQSKDIEVPGWR